MRHPWAVLFLLIPLLDSGPAVGQAVPAGGEFQVNTETADDQSRPDVAMDADGDFVVVWQSDLQDGSRSGVFGQRYDRSGVPLGDEFQINVTTTRDQNVASVAADADGDFVVVWTDAAREGPGLASGISGRLFDRAGNPTSGELQINTYQTSVQNNSRVAMDAAGGFVAVWQSFGQDGSDSGLFGRRFDRAGHGLGGEFQVNTTTLGSQSQPGLAINAGGDFVVVWASADGDDNGIFGRVFDRSGTAVGGELQVNTTTAYDQAVPSVAIAAGGDFVVVWASDGPGGTTYATYSDVVGRRFDRAGNPLGGEFLVNATTDYIQFNPEVAMQPSGEFVVVWGDYQPGGPYGYYLYPNVAGQRFDRAGSPVGGELQVNTTTDDDQQRPAVAIDEVGDFVVVWEDRGGYYSGYNGRDGDGSGVFGQRYEVPPRALKRGAADALGLLPPTGDPETDAGIAAAIADVEASLADDLWADDQHLTALGKRVFDEEKKAAAELMAVLDLDDDDSDSDPELGPAAEGAVVQALGSLVVADRKLAATARDAAVAAAKVAGCVDGGDGDSDCDCGKAWSEIVKAGQELEAAEDELADGRFDKAISRYRQAWEAARKASAAVSGCPAP